MYINKSMPHFIIINNYSKQIMHLQLDGIGFLIEKYIYNNYRPKLTF